MYVVHEESATKIITKVRWSWDHLIFIMGNPVLVRWYLYIEIPHPRRCSTYRIRICITMIFCYCNINLNTRSAAIFCQISSDILNNVIRSTKNEIIDRHRNLGEDISIVLSAVRTSTALRWRHSGCDGVSNHQPHDLFTQPLIQTKMKEIINVLGNMHVQEWLGYTHYIHRTGTLRVNDGHNLFTYHICDWIWFTVRKIQYKNHHLHILYLILVLDRGPTECCFCLKWFAKTSRTSWPKINFLPFHRLKLQYLSHATVPLWPLPTTQPRVRFSQDLTKSRTNEIGCQKA